MTVSARPIVFAAAAGSLAAVGTALAGNSTGFADARADTEDAPDITNVSVSNDDGGTITLRETVSNRDVPESGDQLGFVFDVDQNPDTGSALYGTEVAVVFDGGRLDVYRAGSDGYLSEETPRPPSLQATFSGGVATFSFKASDLGITPGLGFNVTGTSFGGLGDADTAPDIRTFNYQMAAGAPPPALGPDTRAPLDDAVTAVGIPGLVAHLDYFASDGRGATADTIRIFHGRRVIKTIRYRLEDTNPFVAYVVRWKVPSKPKGKYRFCVSSVDAAGNKSNVDCARIVIL